MTEQTKCAKCGKAKDDHWLCHSPHKTYHLCDFLKQDEFTPSPAPVGGEWRGRATKQFVCHYYHDGVTWSQNINAYDWADAEARVKKLGNLVLDGELMGTVPARAGWIVKIVCGIRNLFSTGGQQ